jgi:hypothetical protein
MTQSQRYTCFVMQSQIQKTRCMKVKAISVYLTHTHNTFVTRYWLMNLFRAFSVANNDEHFVLYIEQRQNSYEDGAVTLVDELMESALNQYQLRVEEGIWNAVAGRKDQQILALQAQLEANLKSPRGPPAKQRKERILLQGRR